MTNLFAFRATDPTELGKTKDPVGPENDEIILGAAAEAATVICGWGNHGRRMDRGPAVRQMLRRAGIVAKALSRTKTGGPDESQLSYEEFLKQYLTLPESDEA